MLAQRVATAVVLLAVLAASLAASSPLWFEGVVLALVCGGLWEWLRLCGMPSPRAAMVAIPLALASWAFWTFGMPALHWGLMAAAVLMWLAYGVPSLKRGLPPADAGRFPWPLAVFGMVALAACAIAVLTALAAHGGIFLISLMAIVWVADIAAYFVGKAIGKHKLAPRISPGKTWEGAAGGACGVLLFGALCLALPQGEATYVGVLRAQYGLAVALFALAVLTALSVAGDLFESMLKRRVGMKDSSQLLPGHGGVLDRIDALLPVLPLALWIAR